MLIFLLCASFFCSACINNFAVQELNQIGKEYLDKGEYDSAIARFQSCLDLDENIFETRYNLGVAYIGKKDYENAILNLKRAIELNPASGDAYYSLAVALEGDGVNLNNPDEKPLPEEIKTSLEQMKEAVSMYEKYLLIIQGEDEAVQTHIIELKNDIEQCETFLKGAADDTDSASS
ncbi:MAG: tetratricopeptide repeat protein [Candidatus Gastranaerophilales bacterium]|nr:tetratricopeptide repeat protein [Candidatus Gastranaerophilales bacterium]